MPAVTDATISNLQNILGRGTRNLQEKEVDCGRTVTGTAKSFSLAVVRSVAYRL
jgi:hypothetical protein